MKQKILQEIGLTKNESLVYLNLLELGLTTVSALSKKCKLHRSNVYDAIERLIEKGLVAYIIKNDTKYYEATDPDSLHNLIKEKEIQLKTIMPQLKLSQQLAEEKSEAHIYKGLTAAKNIINHMLSKKKTIYVYGVIKGIGELASPFLANFHKRRIAAKIWMHHIYNTDAQDRINFLKTLDYTAVRTLPREFDSPVATNICGDEVIFILWSKDALVIQIINKDIANAYKKYFDLLWSLARE